MKRRVFSIAVTCCVLALVTATAFAQLPGEPIRADIPFDFTVRGKVLPAGKYEISRITNAEGGLEIFNVNRHHAHAIVETEPVEGAISNRGELVFHRYGDIYFLHEIWTPGVETGRELPTTRQERTLRRETASTGKSAEPQTVALAID
jgi:hypothetical protein